MSRFKLFICAAALAAFFSSNLLGMTVIATEDFTYADGSLVPNGGWANHSGNAGDLLVTSGAAVVQHGTPSEDANLNFGSYSSGTLTASFDIVVNDDTVIGGGDYEYFAHFFTNGSFNFRSRLDVVPPTGAGDFTLGISSASSTAEATLASDFAYGSTVPVVLEFDLDSGTGSLTAGGQTIMGSANGMEALDSFALRQSDSSNNESVTVDNLVISHMPVPEPNPLMLCGLALISLVGLRRRK